VIGIACKDLIKTLSNPLFAAIMIAITGGILFISDRLKGKELDSSDLNVKKSLLIGLGQAIALMPGISRSGTTITFGLITGLKRQQAAVFSFLLSIPAILGATVLEMETYISLDTSQLLIYFTGFIMAFVSGYFVISWLMKLIVKAKLRYFSYYCWAVSAICIGLILYGVQL
jgi:undecaprenyl-diphosphatase